MKLTTRDKRALVLGAGGLVLILIVHFVMIPFADGWTQTRDQIALKQKRVSNLESKISRVVGQRTRLTKAYGPAMKEPLEGEQTARIHLFEAANDLKSSGFKATAYNPQADKLVQGIPNVKLISLQVVGQCDLSKLTKMLVKIREAKTMVIVDRLIITNNEKSPGKLEVSVTLATLSKARV
jgi:hypothetical protein